MAYPVSSEGVKVAWVVVSFHAHRALGQGCQREAQCNKENAEASSLCDGTHFSCLLFVLLPSPGHRFGTTPGNIRIFQKTSPCACDATPPKKLKRDSGSRCHFVTRNTALLCSVLPGVLTVTKPVVAPWGIVAFR